MPASGTLKPVNTVSTSAGWSTVSSASRCMSSSLGSTVPNESATWVFMKYDVLRSMWVLNLLAFFVSYPYSIRIANVRRSAMALKNKIDPGLAQQRLAEWLATRIPEAAQARVDEVAIPGSNGLSCETVLFDATWSGERRRLVARVAPHPDDDATALFPSYDLELEAKIMT